jgi:hypothetical protein
MKSAILWLVGGICTGSGIALAATGGFGMANGPTATVFSTLGYDGLDNLQIHSQGVTALVLFITGVALLAGANAGAWKQTNGY